MTAGDRQTCPNCATTVLGEYCHVCGQREIDLDSLSLSRLIRNFVNELVSLDFASVRTLKALLRPGYLTREYLEGRRRPYLNPIKIYLLCAAIFFLAAPFVGFSFQDFTREPDSAIERLVTTRLQQRQIDRALFAERFDLRLQTVYTISLAVSVAGLAVLLRLLFRRDRRPIGAGIVFALHYVAFLYVSTIAIGAVVKLSAIQGPWTLLVTYAVVFPYLFLALRRVYGESVGRSLLKTLAIAVLTLVLDTAVNLGALLLTIRLV